MTPEPEAPFVLPGGVRAKLRWIGEVWRPHRGWLVFLLGFTLVSSGVAIAYPFVFKLVLDQLGEQAALGGPIRGGEDVLRRILWSLGAICAARFVAGLYPGMRGWMNLKFDLDVRARVFARILEKDHTFFRRFRTGDLVTRLLDDISEYPKIAWFCCSGFFRALDSASKLLFCVGAMLLLDWRLSLLAVAPLPLLVWAIYAVRQRLTRAYEAQQKAISDTNDMLETTFSGIRIVKAFRAEEGQTRALRSLLERRATVQYEVARLWGAFQVLETAVGRLGQMIVLGVGGTMVVRGDLTLGTLYAIYVYLDMLVQPMMDLPNLLVTSRQAFVCIDRAEEVIRFPVQIAHPPEGSEISRISTLDLAGVACGYDAERPVLKGVDLTFRSGERVAVLGAVASGKSTLLKLLAGLIVPARGTIFVNGEPLEGMRWESYRRRIGYAPQESLLFSETIRDNVVLGREDDDPERLARVLAAAQMTADLERLPDGAGTVLGQRGSRVSGGQRQRISIARALWSTPEVLLLDDCTASLDSENEDRLWGEIERLFPEAIVLVVSHRPATFRRADRVVFLANGVVADSGTHDELLARSAAYRDLLVRVEERARLDGAASLDPAGSRT